MKCRCAITKATGICRKSDKTHTRTHTRYAPFRRWEEFALLLFAFALPDFGRPRFHRPPLCLLHPSLLKWHKNEKHSKLNINCPNEKEQQSSLQPETSCAFLKAPALPEFSSRWRCLVFPSLGLLLWGGGSGLHSRDSSVTSSSSWVQDELEPWTFGSSWPSSEALCALLSLSAGMTEITLPYSDDWWQREESGRKKMPHINSIKSWILKC